MTPPPVTGLSLLRNTAQMLGLILDYPVPAGVQLVPTRETLVDIFHKLLRGIELIEHEAQRPR
jgi:hypothetical protein